MEVLGEMELLKKKYIKKDVFLIMINFVEGCDERFLDSMGKFVIGIVKIKYIDK